MGRMIRYLLVMLCMASPALAQDTGLAVWSKIHEVFSHPRCANCHVGADNVPIWSGPGYGSEPRPHGMNISGGASRKGAEHIACDACHTRRNSQLPHGPPGAHVWLLPPVSMQWFGKSSAEICAQIKDPARNGGRSLQQILMHLADDPLVGWAWAPGFGREPAPGTQKQLAVLIEAWLNTGAVCPK
jgi:hypothetical protein